MDNIPGSSGLVLVFRRNSGLRTGLYAARSASETWGSLPIEI